MIFSDSSSAPWNLSMWLIAFARNHMNRTWKVNSIIYIPPSSLSVMKLLFLFSEGKQENTHINNKRNVFLSQAILNLTMDSKFGRLQCDSYLYDYIELFKCKLIAAESKDV